MATNLAALPQRRCVHRRGFLSGAWIVERNGHRATPAPDNLVTILIRARPERMVDVERRLSAIGAQAITHGSPSCLRVSLFNETADVAAILTSIAGLPGVIAASLANTALSEGDA